MGTSKNPIKARGQGGNTRKSAVYKLVHEHFERISNADIAASADF
jgi:hypothetical protein